jgi:UDP-N-acetylglucosamine--N-acetylmuramyl-(pentapeptide) pyrophosphoryl-undecaprenol N-acetylglucosamine transferase
MRSLLVASAGGHLEELWMLRARMMGIGDDVVWVTWDTPYSRSVLEGEQRIVVHGTGPRDLVGAARYAVQARRILAQGEWMSVVSTGALIGLPFLAVARARGIGAHFIESTARVEEPSLTGRLLERVPGVHRYSQYQRGYSRPGWIHRGSVFDSFAPGPIRTGPVRSVVVTVGTNQFSFRRLVERVAAIVPPGVHVVWQTGSTDTSGLDIDSHVLIPAEDLAGAMRHADLVIAHAGAGSAISAMRAGRRPVLVPRRSLHHEHVDDHQAQIGAELGRQGLATALEVDDLSWAGLTAACQQVTQPSSPAMFDLVEGGVSSPIRLADRRPSWAAGRPRSRAAS